MGSWYLAVKSRTGLISAMTLGQAAWAEAIGQIKTLSGDVAIVRENAKSPAKAGDLLEKADTLITGIDGRVGVTFDLIIHVSPSGQTVRLPWRNLPLIRQRKRENFSLRSIVVPWP